MGRIYEALVGGVGAYLASERHEPRNELRGIVPRWGSRIWDEGERGQRWGRRKWIWRSNIDSFNSR